MRLTSADRPIDFGTSCGPHYDRAAGWTLIRTGNKEMQLADWSALSQFVSAGAVTVSLIFVGLQIRRNTNATRAATFQASVGYEFASLTAIGTSPSTASIFLAYRDHPETLEGEALMQGQILFTGLLRHAEHIYLQYQSGMLSKAGWSTREQFLRNIIRTPGYGKFLDRRNAQNINGHFIDFARAVLGGKQ
jgi:hypothetical protein